MTNVLERAHEMLAEEEPHKLPASETMVNGVVHLLDHKQRLVPKSAILAQDLLMDEIVRKIMVYAIDLSAQIARFSSHTKADVGGLRALLDQEYGVPLGGSKGNITLTSFDGCLHVRLKIADVVRFGPELQAAKTLIDECLREWSGDSHPHLAAVVEQAFNVDKENQVNQAEMFSLLRREIDDDRWRRAMRAIRDSIRPIGSKEYLNFYRRDTPSGAWQTVTIDLAAVS